MFQGAAGECTGLEANISTKHVTTSTTTTITIEIDIRPPRCRIKLHFLYESESVAVVAGAGVVDCEVTVVRGSHEGGVARTHLLLAVGVPERRVSTGMVLVVLSSVLESFPESMCVHVSLDCIAFPTLLCP